MKINDPTLLAIRTLAATAVFVVASAASIQLIARNNPIAEGVTIFTAGFFALILAVLGVDGWQLMKTSAQKRETEMQTAAQKRETEWKPSQHVVDQIQLSRKIVSPLGEHDPVIEAAEAGAADDGAVG